MGCERTGKDYLVKGFPCTVNTDSLRKVGESPRNEPWGRILQDKFGYTHGPAKSEVRLRLCLGLQFYFAEHQKNSHTIWIRAFFVA